MCPLTREAIVIRGGRLLDPALGLDREGDILVKAGRIKAIGPNLEAGGAEEFLARGLVVCPGLIDMHVHFRTPGEEHKETIATGSAAAAAGGFTAVACEPNTRPALDSGILVKQLQGKAELQSLVRCYLKGCLTLGAQGEELVDVEEMKAYGAVALSSDPAPIENPEVMKEALKQCREYQLLPTLHEEASGKVPFGPDSHRREPELVARDISLAEETHSPIHFQHISTAEAVAAIDKAKKRGLAVSAEVTPHHLALCREDAPAGDANWKVNPPLRTKADREAMQKAMAEGVIDCIATDHAPHTPEEKALSLAEAPFGVIGLETALGVVLTTLYHCRLMTLPQIIMAMSARPRALLGLPEVRLAEGGAAELTLFDPEAEWVVEPERFYSKGRNCPFAGQTLKGRPVATMVSGRWVMREGEVQK